MSARHLGFAAAAQPVSVQQLGLREFQGGAGRPVQPDRLLEVLVGGQLTAAAELAGALVLQQVRRQIPQPLGVAAVRPKH